MDNPKIRLLLDMGTNRLKNNLSRAKNLVDQGVGGMKSKLKELKLETIANLSKLKQNLGEARATIDRGTDDILGSFKRKALAYAGWAAIGAGIISSINSGLEGSANKIAFETLVGKDAGDKLFGDLTKMAQDSIFGNELYDMGKTMLAFGADVRDVLPDIKMLGDISMGNKEKLQSLVLAYSQIRSAGRLTGQDLLQLVGTGFNPLQKIHEKTGQSMTALKKKMEDGKITFDMVRKTFIDATSAGGQFYDMTNKIAGTEFGQWEAMKGQIQGIALALGTALLPTIGKVFKELAPAIDLVPGILAAVTPALSSMIQLLVPVLHLVGTIAKTLSAILSPVINKVAGMISSFLNPVLKFVADNLDAIAIGLGAAAIAWGIFNVSTILATISTGLWTAAFWLLNIAMKANPIGIVITVIGLLVAGIVWAVKHTEGWASAWVAFKKTVSIIWKQMQMDWDLLKSSFIFGFNIIKLEFKSFGEYVMAIVGNIKKAWDLAWDGNFGEAKKALFADIHTEAGKQIEELKAAQQQKVADYLKQTQNNAKDMAEAWKGINIKFKSGKDEKAEQSGLNPDKATAGATGGGASTKTDAAAASKVTGAASQTRNVTISFGSYIKGDVISQSNAIKGMGKDELDRWLREHFLRLLQSIEQAY